VDEYLRHEGSLVGSAMVGNVFVGYPHINVDAAFAELDAEKMRFLLFRQDQFWTFEVKFRYFIVVWFASFILIALFTHTAESSCQFQLVNIFFAFNACILTLFPPE